MEKKMDDFYGKLQKLTLPIAFQSLMLASVAAGDALAVTFQGIGGYDTDELTFRPFEPRLETGSVFAWKRHRTFSEASRVFLDAMRAQLEG